MRSGIAAGLALAAALAMASVAPAARAEGMKVVSERTVRGFPFPKSVAYDPNANVLYVSQFVSALMPTAKDGKGKISKVSLDGRLLEDRFLPARGGVLNKPKGIWVSGNRLWVTDIDVVWVFDVTARTGRKVDLPGTPFASDVAVAGKVLYASDNRGDQVYKLEPADFLQLRSEPKVTRIFPGKPIHPNGLYPARDGTIIMVGFLSAEEARGIYALNARGGIKELAKDIGRLDGVYQLPDGTLLVTDWNSGALLSWSASAGKQILAGKFDAPADFCVVPEGNGFLVVVPDLVKGELRLIRLAK